MKLFSLIVITCLFLTIAASAQEQTRNFSELDLFYRNNSNKQGYVTLTENIKIDQLLQRHIAVNMKQKGIAGWRIQIFLGSGRDAAKSAQSIKTKFIDEYPETDVYLDYQAPYFRVRVGNYRKTDKHLAMKFKKEISASFPNSWIVEDLIDYQKL